MNDRFIFFKSMIYIPVITILVFALFSFLQHIVPRCNGSPKWWKTTPQRLKSRIARLFLVARWMTGGIRNAAGSDTTVEPGSQQDAVP